MRSGAAPRKRTRHSAWRGRLTSCDAAPSMGEERRLTGGVSGDAIRSDDEVTHEAQHAARPAHGLQRGAERGREERARGNVSGDAIRRGGDETHAALARSTGGSLPVTRRRAGARGRRQRGSVSGDAMRGVDEVTCEAQRTARPAHRLRRGAKRGRGEAAERERRERQRDLKRRRGNAGGTAHGATDSLAATRRRAGARGAAKGRCERRCDQKRRRGHARGTKRAAWPAHELRRGAERGRGGGSRKGEA